MEYNNTDGGVIDTMFVFPKSETGFQIADFHVAYSKVKTPEKIISEFHPSFFKEIALKQDLANSDIMKNIGQKLKEIMNKFDIDNGSSIGNKIKIPIGKISKNDRAVITCVMYTEIPYEKESYNFQLPFKYVPECLFKDESSVEGEQNGATEQQGETEEIQNEQEH